MNKLERNVDIIHLKPKILVSLEKYGDKLVIYFRDSEDYRLELSMAMSDIAYFRGKLARAVTAALAHDRRAEK